MNNIQFLNLYVMIVLISSFSSLLLAFYSWFGIKNKISFYFGMLMMTFTIYCFGYANELGGKTLNDFMFWIRFEYLGVPFTGPFWVLFTSEVSGYKRWMNKWVIGLVFFIPVLTVLLIMTNDYHYLYYTFTKVTEVNGFPHIQFGKGFFYALYQSYYNVAFFVGDILLLKMYLKSHSYYKKQALIMLVASIIPWIGYALYISGYSPMGFELTPICLLIMGPVLLIGITKYKMMDLTPTALELVFMTMNEAVFVFDNNNRLVNFNLAGKNVIENLEYDNIGKHIMYVFEQYPELIAILTGKESDNQIISINNNSKIKYYQYNLNEMYESHGKKVGKTLLLTDVTNQIELMEKLKEAATIDELTKLYNRRFFREMSEIEFIRAVRKNHPIACLMMDIDHFKQVNDTYGHDAGDEVLREVGKILKSTLRNIDVVGRYGGEEFAIIIPETEFVNVCQIAERIRNRIDETEIKFQNITLKITVSIGLYFIKHVEKEILDDLIRNSDIELYMAKNSGRNCVRFLLKE